MNVEGKFFKLVVCLFISLFAAAAGSWLTVPLISCCGIIGEYPIFMPPFWLFTPLCLIIFMFQGLGMYHLWQKRSLRQLRFVIALFFIQIVLNLGWLFLFFGVKMPVAATIEGILAVPVLLFLIYEVYEIEKKAALYFIFSVVCITYRLSISIGTAFMN